MKHAVAFYLVSTMRKTKRARITSVELTSGDEPTQSQNTGKGKKPAQELPKLTPEQRVPKPTFDGRPHSGLADTGRSEEVRFQETLEQAQRRVQNFVRYADKIRVPLRLRDLVRDMDVKGMKAKLEKVCLEELGDEAPSRAFSAKYYDLDDKPLFFYLGVRWKDGKQCGSKVLELVDQYKSSTEKDLDLGVRNNRELVYDGFHGDILII
ncbi:hypothetical protein Hypma_005597 [Hypsizygus marmoreus]|uniref:Uncharacterized protein n=1 Tax=Hypsizygus marmoreus TaxID=39966 RepID=A0A369JW35_HYPMA|nr:hypothetical protein Hypma_005597 [Hypsizygus marmoreus]